jgi:hypothetical protein
MPTDHTARIAEIEARLAAATEGPWLIHEPDALFDDPNYGVTNERRTILIAKMNRHRGQSKENAALVAHAPADLAYLIERVRELEAQVDRCSPPF